MGFFLYIKYVANIWVAPIGGNLFFIRFRTQNITLKNRLHRIGCLRQLLYQN
jgi:hypothetical protein